MNVTLPSPRAAETGATTISVRGARTHNLLNIDVELPLGRLIVVTGVSGSGKSSLAFDTIFAEGQRRYLESVSVHTRTLLRELARPDVDEVSGLPPTVCVDQKVSSAPARSTLAMTTQIHDYLRLLYAKAGTAHCTGCGQQVTSQTVDQIVDRTLQLPDRTKLLILSPMVRGRRGTHKDTLDRIARNGFVRVRVDGQQFDIADVPDMPASRQHQIDAVIDRIILKDGIRPRLQESVRLAVRESDGTCIVCEQTDAGWQDRLFSTKFSCPDCDLSFATPEPRSFSFNTAWGACPDCEGFGVRGIVDDAADVTVFRREACPTCHGSRLQPFASRVTFLGQSIADFTALSVDDALDWLRNVWGDGDAADSLTREAGLVAARTVPDIRQRLECLQRVGLGYLTLNRPSRTLSGGEFQRARLAACLGTGLHGACFILDEPTAGLHPRDTRRLLQTICEIRDSGATVIVVEHDGDVMRHADWLVDLGPGAGAEGGRLLFAGALSAIGSVETPTTRYLQRDRRSDAESVAATSFTTESVAALPSATIPTDSPAITIRDARLHNLQNVTVDIPLRRLVCVTGVSGSGKSSLIMDTLLPVATAFLQNPEHTPTALADARCGSVDGLHHVSRVVAVDHSPPGRSRRSNIATYSGLWDHIRKLLAKTREARTRGFTAKRFSFNSGDGRCGACKGTGAKNVQMDFLPDAVIPCPECRGNRFNAATLAVRFAGHSAADILNLRVDQALELFREFDALRTLLQTFRDTGLGYLTLGQPTSTFSGGEAQRVRLATDLASRHLEVTLYVLDEPTRGLHPADVERLVAVLRALVTAGHSVLVIEHNTDVMRSVDWLIDIGPDSAAAGGQLVFSGPVSAAINSAAGHTADALRADVAAFGAGC